MLPTRSAPPTIHRMNRGAGLGVLLIACLWQSHAKGQSEPVETPNPAPIVPQLAVAVGAVAGYSYGHRCSPAASDVVDCTNASLPVGFRAAVRWRFSEAWAIGAFAGIDWLKGGPGDNPITWQTLQPAGRYYLGEADGAQTWLEAGIGVVKAKDTLPAYLGPNGTALPAPQLTTWGPAGSLAFGRDFELVRHWGVAPELRLQAYGLSRDERSATYGPQTMVLVGFSVIGFGFYR